MTLLRILTSICLAILIHAQVLTASDPNLVTVTYPPNKTAAASFYFTKTYNNYLGNGAQWIFVNNATQYWPEGYNATFQHQFYSFCPTAGAAYLVIATPNAVGLIWFNGFIVGTTNNSTNSQNFGLILQCGVNNLTIKIINRSTNGSLGLIYYAYQSWNSAKCYKCGYGAIYNFLTCSCQCIRCGCAANQQWVDYPTCGCRCRNEANVACTSLQYFNQLTCSCACIPVLCPRFFDQDPSSCACRCKARSCQAGLGWSYNRCRCLANSTIF